MQKIVEFRAVWSKMVLGGQGDRLEAGKQCPVSFVEIESLRGVNEKRHGKVLDPGDGRGQSFQDAES